MFYKLTEREQRREGRIEEERQERRQCILQTLDKRKSFLNCCLSWSDMESLWGAKTKGNTAVPEAKALS